MNRTSFDIRIFLAVIDKCAIYFFHVRNKDIKRAYKYTSQDDALADIICDILYTLYTFFNTYILMYFIYFYILLCTSQNVS